MLKHLPAIILIFLFASACVKPQTEINASNNNSGAMNSSEIVNANTSDHNAGTESASNNSNVKTFLGYIGGKRVQINLTRDGSNLSGTYLYEKIGTDLKLSGTIDAAGNFTLQERDAAGNKTGEWKGSWKEADGRATLTGKWKGAKGKPELEFSADEQLVEFTNGAKLVTKSVNEISKAKHYEITGEYPELTGVNPATAANFNELVKKIVADSNARFKENISDLTPEDLKRFTGDADLYDEVTYDVILANDDIISLFFTDASYTGGAHPNATSATINFDLKNNRELKLADLFEPNANYLKTISDYSLADLKRQLQKNDMLNDEFLNGGASAKEDNFKSWNLTKKGLQINFDAYQVAAYAAGPQTVVIPYAKLQNILRRDGAAAKLAK
ncbi:MAG: DUF3298 and DUF4163 domain-containing protein [Pyrinomonadaceae bacterium]